MLALQLFGLLASLYLAASAPEPQPKADAEAEADPDAAPDSDPEAQSRLLYSGMPSFPPAYGAPILEAPIMEGPVLGGISPLNFGGGGRCGLVNECCGMADQGCCVGGQKCFTKYERVCRYQNQPVCKTVVQRACVTHPIKYCRTISTPRSFYVPTLRCQKKREKKCWKYERQQCKMSRELFVHNVTWTDQEAVPLPEKTEEKCYNVNSCKIVDDSQPVQRQVPQQKCENVPQSRPVCRSVPVPSQPQERKSTVWETTYQQRCYNVPRVKCSMVGCNYGGCPSPAQTCSVGGYQTQSVCAQSAGSCMGDGCQQDSSMCQQVETPLCQAGPAPCQAGPEQCCTTEMERVCQQIPIRVPRIVSTMEQGPMQFQQVCETVTDYKQECRTIMITTTVNVPTKRCETGVEKKCIAIRVPDVEIRTTEKSEALKYQYSNCTLEEVEDQHCAEVDVGVTCTPQQERKTVNIQSTVCDQQRQQQYCHEIPYSSCSNVGGQVCEMVPREVCQDKCQTSTSCNKCSEFVSGGGYGSCSTDTCNNFYPSTSGLAVEGSGLFGNYVSNMTASSAVTVM